jgi:uncharacterized protein YecE (DUF72 family)
MSPAETGEPAARVRFGPAGWSYKDWEGIVYPKPARKGFDQLGFIASWFDTIEINSTFYRPAPRQMARDWARRTLLNPRFRFTVKLWRRFTHERGTAWSSDEVHQAREGLEALAEDDKLGAVLIQFPWSFKRTPENNEWLHDLLSAFRELPLVLEVRHVSWEEPEFFETLAERGVGFVNVDQPLFKKSIRPSARATSPVGYVRVHGRNYKDWFRKSAGPLERYDYLYTADELQPWAERVKQIAANPRTHEVYVVTNNHARGKAPTNALMLQSMVEERPVPAPEGLYAEYADVLGPFAVPASAPGDEHLPAAPA